MQHAVARSPTACCYFHGMATRPWGNKDAPAEEEAALIGLPLRPFFYTLDQIAGLLSLELASVRQSYIFFDGRNVGVPPRGLMRAVNIAPDGEKPEWRVVDKELIRWARYKGFRFYHTGNITH